MFDHIPEQYRPYRLADPVALDLAAAYLERQTSAEYWDRTWIQGLHDDDADDPDTGAFAVTFRDRNEPPTLQILSSPQQDARIWITFASGTLGYAWAIAGERTAWAQDADWNRNERPAMAWPERYPDDYATKGFPR